MAYGIPGMNFGYGGLLGAAMQPTSYGGGYGMPQYTPSYGRGLEGYGQPYQPQPYQPQPQPYQPQLGGGSSSYDPNATAQPAVRPGFTPGATPGLETMPTMGGVRPGQTLPTFDPYSGQAPVYGQQPDYLQPYQPMPYEQAPYQPMPGRGFEGTAPMPGRQDDGYTAAPAPNRLSPTTGKPFQPSPVPPGAMGGKPRQPVVAKPPQSAPPIPGLGGRPGPRIGSAAGMPGMGWGRR